MPLETPLLGITLYNFEYNTPNIAPQIIARTIIVAEMVVAEPGARVYRFNRSLPMIPKTIPTIPPITPAIVPAPIPLFKQYPPPF